MMRDRRPRGSRIAGDNARIQKGDTDYRGSENRGSLIRLFLCHDLLESGKRFGALFELHGDGHTLLKIV